MKLSEALDGRGHGIDIRCAWGLLIIHLDAEHALETNYTVVSTIAWTCNSY